MKHPKKVSRHVPKKCKYCREWYRETIKETKKIKDKLMREKLLNLWETLWLNNCGDFDIICYEFAHYGDMKKAKEVKFKIDKNSFKRSLIKE